MCINLVATLIAAADLAALVNPFVGTAGNGHTTPAAACPFGMIQAGPDTGNYDWRHCAGYHWDDKTLIGFSQNHISGAGRADLGDVRILPYCGEGQPPKAMPFDKASERAEPGFYSVKTRDAEVEIAASPRTAIYRIRYTGRGPRKMLLNPAEGLATNKSEMYPWIFPFVPRVSAAVENDGRRIVGDFRRQGWVTRDVYYAIESDVEMRIVRYDDRGEWYPPYWIVDFPEGTEVIELRISVSARSIEGAKRNLAAESHGRDLQTIKNGARAMWNERLAKAGEGRDKVFYTAVYHACYQPNLFSDVGEKERYATFSYWDTFRSAHPLYTIIARDKVPYFAESIMDQYRQVGTLASWSLWGEDGNTMIGVHAVPVLVDAILKGLVPKGFDENAAFEAIKDSLTKTHRNKTEEDWAVLDKYGYYPIDVIYGQSVSRTTEIAYDDACAARLAERLGRKADAEYFRKRAGNWRNVFDPKLGLVRPRLANGEWKEPFNPLDCGYFRGFTEANSHQYTFHVMHDVEGLIEAMGGREKFVARLEALFAMSDEKGAGWQDDITGLIGQYVHGNEPSHHIPYLFAAAGRPDLTEKYVKMICERFYKDAPDGLCGNDDCGQMSAWYVLAVMGRGTVDPCARQ